MSGVDLGPDWFRGWLSAHLARFPGAKWGEDPGEVFDGWRRSFRRHRVTPAEALEASLRCMEGRPYPDAMLAALLAAVREIRGTMQDNGPIIRGADCEFCGGTGWAAVPPCGRYPAGSVCICECDSGDRIGTPGPPPVARLADRPDLRERIVRDREEREARGALAMAARGHDGYGTDEEVRRGFRAVTLAGGALKSIDRSGGSDGQARG